MTKPRPFDSLPLPTQAGIICNSADFQRYAATRLGFPPGTRATPSAAAQFLRDECRAYSRASIEPGTDAAQKFAALRTDFDAWRGKIADPRT